jgi:hypothetical protein
MIHVTPPPISDQAMADLLCTLMVLCKGYDAKKNPIWAYLCIKPSMAKSFKEARERGNIDISDYGTVIESGEGVEPSEAIKKRMEQDYGMNHSYEQELLDKIAALQKNAMA